MHFDIINALEIPQGATELTISQLKQISGGHDGQGSKNKHNKCHRENRCEKRNKRKNNCDNRNSDNNY